MEHSSPPLVGLVGLARAGKDTTASILADEAAFERVAFADSLKRAALDLDPIVSSPAPAWRGGRLSEVVEAVGWEMAKVTPEVRRFLQEFGLAIRGLDADFWVRVAMTGAQALLDEGSPVAITDVRFPNEVEAVRSAGGLIVKVDRPGAGLTGEAAAHPSETLARSIEPDWTITNHGTLDDLRLEVHAFYLSLPHIERTSS